jgi:hypothetical protein
MTAYSIFIESSSAEFLLGLKSKEQNQLLRLFEKLRFNPFLEGDYIEHDDVGRNIQITIVGRFAICYWLTTRSKKLKFSI